MLLSFEMRRRGIFVVSLLVAIASSQWCYLHLIERTKLLFKVLINAYYQILPPVSIIVQIEHMQQQFSKFKKHLPNATTIYQIQEPPQQMQKPLSRYNNQTKQMPDEPFTKFKYHLPNSSTIQQMKQPFSKCKNHFENARIIKQMQQQNPLTINWLFESKIPPWSLKMIILYNFCSSQVSTKPLHATTTKHMQQPFSKFNKHLPNARTIYQIQEPQQQMQ